MIDYEVECFNCKKSIPDPEYGYTCSIEEWDYFPKAHTTKNNRYCKCPYYKVDKDFLQKQLDDFVKKRQRGNLIMKNSKPEFLNWLLPKCKWAIDNSNDIEYVKKRFNDLLCFVIDNYGERR